MTSENALKACALDLLASELEADGLDLAATLLRQGRARVPEQAALRAIEKALTRASGWEDERAALVNALQYVRANLGDPVPIGRRHVARKVDEALAKSLPSPPGEGM